MNITDYDNSVVKEEKKTRQRWRRFTRRYERLFRQDLSGLNCLPAHAYPHASQFAARMADAAAKLRQKGLAYEDGKGRVFLDISKFPGYGRLAGRRIRGSGRVMREEYKPFQAGDFLLWSSCPKGKCDDCFSTSLGWGVPAWNLQCACMSSELLGGQVDVAMGGIDNRFNHHENTRAVMQGLHGKEYAKYWLHVRHLNINGKKMSKSKGNAVLLPEMARKGFEPRMVRMLLLGAHYRKGMAFSWGNARKVGKRFAKMKRGIDRLREVASRKAPEGLEGFGGSANIGNVENAGVGRADFERLALRAKVEFEKAMDDDLDAPSAIDAVERFLLRCSQVRGANQARKALALLEGLDRVLACLPL
jgi:cysteinyl-tRNA synthetase